MPDLVTIALGGGTIVHGDGERGARSGPQAWATDLTEEALVFGGSTPTLTDAAVVGGRVDLGDAGRPRRHATTC